MTEQEFWERARAGRIWGINEFAQVRCANGACPVAAVANPRATGVCAPGSSAVALGLPRAFGWRVANAADRNWDPNRPWLLKNLGVGSRGQEQPQ